MNQTGSSVRAVYECEGPGCAKSGYLMKKGGKSLVWKERLLILAQHRCDSWLHVSETIKYGFIRLQWASKESTTPKGSVPVAWVVAVHDDPVGIGGVGGFQSHCFEIVTTQKTYLWWGCNPNTMNIVLKFRMCLHDLHVCLLLLACAWLPTFRISSALVISTTFCFAFSQGGARVSKRRWATVLTNSNCFVGAWF